MEEVLEKLSSTAVSEPVSGTSYDSLFKNRGRQGSQDERRKWILETQKRRRNEKLDQARGILELVEELDEDMDCGDAAADQTKYRPRSHVAGFHRARPSFRDVLMLSEWLVERPEDLTHNWYLVPCPVGTRVLVVASRGRTKLISKYGTVVRAGASELPGGRPGSRRNASTVLDCVWAPVSEALFVLDLLVWNNQSFVDCDTEFRHYWLSSQLAESEALRARGSHNDFAFSALPKVLCTPDNVRQVLSAPPAALDGLLLYHRAACYTAGRTPLVGWLYPFMLGEVLGQDYSVSERYPAPSDYPGQAEYIREFEEHQKKKVRRSTAARADRPAATSHAMDQQTSDEPTASCLESVTSAEHDDVIDGAHASRRPRFNHGDGARAAPVTPAASHPANAVL